MAAAAARTRLVSGKLTKLLDHREAPAKEGIVPETWRSTFIKGVPMMVDHARFAIKGPVGYGCHSGESGDGWATVSGGLDLSTPEGRMASQLVDEKVLTHFSIAVRQDPIDRGDAGVFNRTVKEFSLTGHPVETGAKILVCHSANGQQENVPVTVYGGTIEAGGQSAPAPGTEGQSEQKATPTLDSKTGKPAAVDPKVVTPPQTPQQEPATQPGSTIAAEPAALAGVDTAAAAPTVTSQGMATAQPGAAAPTGAPAPSAAPTDAAKQPAKPTPPAPKTNGQQQQTPAKPNPPAIDLNIPKKRAAPEEPAPEADTQEPTAEEGEDAGEAEQQEEKKPEPKKVPEPKKQPAATDKKPQPPAKKPATEATKTPPIKNEQPATPDTEMGEAGDAVADPAIEVIKDLKPEQRDVIIKAIKARDDQFKREQEARDVKREEELKALREQFGELKSERDARIASEKKAAALRHESIVKDYVTKSQYLGLKQTDAAIELFKHMIPQPAAQPIVAAHAEVVDLCVAQKEQIAQLEKALNSSSVGAAVRSGHTPDTEATLRQLFGGPASQQNIPAVPPRQQVTVEHSRAGAPAPQVPPAAAKPTLPAPKPLSTTSAETMLGSARPSMTPLGETLEQREARYKRLSARMQS